MHRKLLLVLAGILSLAAQALLFAPDLFQFIPGAIRIFLIPVLFVLVIILYFIILKYHSNGSRTDWIFPTLQACTVLGIFYLLNNTASRDNVNGLVFSGIVTILTTYALYVDPNRIPVPQTNPQGSNIVEVSYGHELIGNKDALNEQINSITQELSEEKYRNTQLTLLNELSQQLEAELDPPVSAQLAVNTLERAIECSIVALFVQDPDHHDFVVLASAGKRTSLIPPGYRQASKTGLLGRTTRFKKTNIINDTRLDLDFVRLENDSTLSMICVPILEHGHVKGVLEICSEKTDAFNSADAAIAEGVASELLSAWERSSYQHRLTELIQAGISLTIPMDPQSAIQEIAIIARRTLEAQFVYIKLLDQQGNFSRTASSGNAPRLLASLNSNLTDDTLVRAALNAAKPFRVRDLRKYSSAKKLEIDHSGLRSMIAIPIRLRHVSIGSLLAFGKQEGIFFSENDESIASLLSSQAAASTESSWLYQELRNKESITSKLFRLSQDVIRTEELSKAAELIAQAAHKVTNSKETGIVLVTLDGQVEAEVGIDTKGLHTRREHPMDAINRVIQIGQYINIPEGNVSFVCYPLLTPRRTYGALWMNIPESGQNYANIETLANQAAIALERAILLSESRQQAKDIEAAYDLTLTALMSALDARDRETEGHSMRVSQLACLLGEKLGLNTDQLKGLERGALLHDIGKIGISDSILQKPDKLNEDEWIIMRTHPNIGVRIVEGVPFLADTLPVILSHHERWDGSGYPERLKGTDIPIQARIFAVVDVFDALTSTRIYRKKSTPEEAIQYMKAQAGALFDTDVVDALSNLPYADFIQGKRMPL